MTAAGGVQNSRAMTLGRTWDAFDVYLFDIDGTLINCSDATHYFAFCDALQKLSGRPLNLDGITAHGNTDVGILRDVLTDAGIPEAEWRSRVREACAGMGDFVEERADQLCTTVLPQVREVLDHLRTRGAVLGVATGNLERIGRLKLQRAGLFDYFQFGGWSDDYEYRADVFRGAIEKARGLSRPGTLLCVIGDTPSDIRAAHENELPVIAVATGIYTFEQLQDERPELCIRSFEELLARN
jgi:phosphoglycolate phosphatase-like HAD superfamily hydrolase